MNIELKKLSYFKSKLIEYALTERYKQLHDNLLTAIFSDVKQKDIVSVNDLQQEEYYNFLDWFALELRLTDNKTILEHFILENQNNLSSEEINDFSNLKNVFKSTFKIKNVLDDCFYAINLFNLKEYKLKSTISMDNLSFIEKNSFIDARIVPYKDYHVFSGSIIKLDFNNISDIINYISNTISEYPELYYQDNEKGLHFGQILQNKEYEIFTEYFGDEIFICSGYNLRKYYEEFDNKAKPIIKELKKNFRIETLKQHFYNLNVNEIESEQEDYNLIDFNDILNSFSNLDSVAMIYDKIEGLGFYPEFEEFYNFFSGNNTLENYNLQYQENENNENIEDIEDKKIEKYKKVYEYLLDENISPIVFHKMYERYPSNTVLVLSHILNFNPNDIQSVKDIEKHIYNYKSYYYNTKPLPRILPLELNDFVKVAISD